MAEVNFWTRIKYGENAECPAHRILEWVDAYFAFGRSVAVVVPEMMHDQSTGVKLQEESQPLWLTILKVASYATVIIPTILLCAKWVLRSIYPFHICSRTQPDGAEETGIFANVLQQGVRIENGQTFYINPKLLIPDTWEGFMEKELRVNFADIIVDGEHEIILVKKNEDNVFIRSNESLNQALIKLATFDPNVFNWVLEQRSVEAFKDQFFTFLLEPSIDDHRPILNLDPQSLLKILELAHKNHIAIDTQIVDQLFLNVADSGSAETIQALLDLHPEAIQKIREKPELFSQAILDHNLKVIPILFKAMQEQNIAFTLKEQWLHKAFLDDDQFTREDFLGLPGNLPSLVFQAANLHMSQKVILKLREFGFFRKPRPPIPSQLFSTNMDALAVMDTVRHFFGNLRNKNELLTKGEFLARGPDAYRLTDSPISCISVRDSIQKAAEDLELPFIKVPQMIAVIEPENPDSPLLNLEVSKYIMNLNSNDLKIYAEEITPVERYATREELLGILYVLQTLNLSYENSKRPLIGRNAQDEEGIYFCQTDPGFLQPRMVPNEKRNQILAKLMAPEDQEWCKAEIARRERIAQNVDNLQMNRDKNENIGILRGFEHNRRVQLPIADILG